MEPTIGYRRLLYMISSRLSSEERRGLVYMRLFKEREKYRDAEALDVLSKLEANGAFSVADPEGLLTVAKDVKRPDIAKKVRQYIKRRDRDASLSDNSPSTESLSEPLGEQLGRLLALVTTLTEQCLRENGDAGATGGMRYSPGAKGAEGALRTVDILSDVLLKVKKELKNCRQESAPAIPLPRSSSSTHLEVKPAANMATPPVRRAPKKELPAIPSPTAQAESSEAKYTGNTTNAMVRRVPRMDLPAIPSPKAQPDSSDDKPVTTPPFRRAPKNHLPAIPSPMAQAYTPARALLVIQSKQLLPQLKVPLKPPISEKPGSKGLSRAVSMSSTLPRRKESPLVSTGGLRHGGSVEQLQAHMSTHDPGEIHADDTAEDTYEDLAHALEDPLYDYIGPPIPTRSSSVRIPPPEVAPPPPPPQLFRKPDQRQGRSLLVRGPLNSGGTSTGKSVPVWGSQETQGYGGLQNGRVGWRYASH